MPLNWHQLINEADQPGFVRIFWLIVLLLFSLSSCQLEMDGLDPASGSETNVDADLQPYFERFESEGLERGLEIDLKGAGISGFILEITEENIVGQCSHSNQGANNVTIDDEFWAVASDLNKQFIVFHELGHCYLAREHRDDAYPGGQCVSMMRSGLGDCWDLYNIRTREDYIDELFNPELYP